MIENSVSENEVVEISDKVQKSMENLKNLIRDTDIQSTDNYLKRFLYGSNFNEEEAFKKIKKTYEHLLQQKDWYCIEGPLKFKNIIEQEVRALLPDCDCDKEGRPIFIQKNGKIDPNTMGMFDLVAIDDIWIESLLSRNPEVAAKGLCVIIDVKDQHWKLTKWMHPTYVKQSLTKIENMPFKDYKVHVVNNSWWIGIALKIVWPLMPQKFKDMMTFHFNDTETIFEYIDKKVVPIEYGGLKEVKYAELYENLYKRNDEIFKSFDALRNLKT